MVTTQVKNFVELMHDTVVRFYRLDVKTSADVDQCECLTNLLTSLVLKSPVYSDVHQLIQTKFRQEYIKPAMKTIATMRKRKDLEEDLGINVAKMGLSILRE
jgi:hypothetical protein